ncbi:hypothetical protein LguiB_032660 [Lonicera macranthoides]
MGRRVQIKKIEDTTKRQVTFSKQRSSMMEKLKEISTCYNAEDKLQKLRQLDPHIKGDISKLHFLDERTILTDFLKSVDSNLKLQVKKNKLELQIMEANLREYEPCKEQEPSLFQLSWCERNLRQSLEKVLFRKNALLASSSSKQLDVQAYSLEMSKENNEGSTEVSYNLGEKEMLGSSTQNPDPVDQPIMQLDPWISPYSARFRQGILQNIVDQGKEAPSGIFSETLIPPTYNPTEEINNMQNAAFNVQEHEPQRFGQEGQNNLNLQDGTILVNQLNSNEEQFNFSSGDSNSFECFADSQPLNPGRVPYLPVNAPLTATSTSSVTDVAAGASNEINIHGFKPHQQQFFEPKTPPPKVTAAAIEQPELSIQAPEDSFFDDLPINLS